MIISLVLLIATKYISSRVGSWVKAADELHRLHQDGVGLDDTDVARNQLLQQIKSNKLEEEMKQQQLQDREPTVDGTAKNR